MNILIFSPYLFKGIIYRSYLIFIYLGYMTYKSIPKRSVERIFNRFKKVKMGYFLLDRLELKTIAMLVRGQMTIHGENKYRTVERLQYLIRQSIVKNLNKDVFKREFIPTLTYPDSLKNTGRAFIIMEFTFFNKIRDKKLITSELERLMDKVYHEAIDKFEDIEFNKLRPKHRTLCQEAE